MKNIDADLLRKEIERLNGELMYGSDSALIQVETNCKNEAYNEILSCIDSLQQEQPDVDLEKEIEEHAIHMPHGEFASDNEILEDMEWARKEFRHFYELGLNARKEE